MNKAKQNTILFFLITYSVYCALTIGASWDEGAELIKGKITLDYLFSLGQINKSYEFKELYSPIYLSLQYLITEIFPPKYQTNIIHLTNLFISLCAVFGIGKLTKELFNKKVGKITFLILFFYPIFFGHMAFNSKDTILAFCHVWIVYLFFRYLKKGNIDNKSNKYIICIGLLAAVATGQQLLFIGSLLIVILFFLIEIFFIKKIIRKDFSIKKFIFDLLKCFIVFYSLLILFWIDVHGNIFIHPLNNFYTMFSESFWTGWPYNLLNGKYYISSEITPFYFIISFLYKSPEYILLLYIIFLPLIFKSKSFYKEKFKLFNYKLLLIISVLIFPNLILPFFPFPVYDGMRLFLWTLPYFFIIPGLTIYYLIENFKFRIPRITFLILSLFILFYLFKFFSITPYQYTYLNSFNGNNENRYKKFENDYWGSSIKELIKNANFKTESIIKIATCGINDKISKQYFKKREDLIYKFVRSDEAEYIIMTNRVINYNGLVNCFDRFEGNDVATVKRNGLLLSVIRKINTL